MKKVVVLLLVMVMVFGFSLAVSASQMEDVEVIGGITYNLFTSDDFDDLDDYFDGIDSGIGFYAGGRYWFEDNLGVEFGIDYASSSGDIKEDGATLDFSQRIMGPYAKLNFKATDAITLTGGPVYYSGKGELEYLGLSESNSGSGIGFIAGAMLDYPIDSDLAIIGNIDYRLAEIDYDDADELDVSGLRISAGISYQF